MEQEVVRAHVFLSGRVQGVFFREETRRRAESGGLGGWVRNLADGRVEAVFEGPGWMVQSLVEFCRSGPRLARVASVEVGWESPLGERRFRVR